MRTLKILAVATTLLVATAGFALACDGNKTAKAETASTEAATVENASTGCASSAAVKTASAVKTAGAGCSSSASAIKTAGAEGGASCSSALKTAEAAGGCSASQAKLASAVKLETVRMPSGALAVFYHGKNAEAVQYLQASAEKGCAGFACTMAQKVAQNEHCKTEMAATETGVMMLVTSDQKDVVDEFAAQYAVAVAATSDQGE